jgi:uncharacterized RDD family membrane protein YckC
MNQASAKHRLVAGFIDRFFILWISLIYLLWLVSANRIDLILDQLLLVVFLVLIFNSLLYPLGLTLMTTLFGGSPGKLLTGIQVVDAQGQKISFKRAFFRRYIGYMVSGMLFCLGFIWIAIDEQRRGWHDQIADTFVVIRKKQFVFVGLATLIILLGAIYRTGSQIYDQFQTQIPFYQEIIDDISEGLKPTPDPEEVIPFPEMENLTQVEYL